jgi:hypothetical protein
MIFDELRATSYELRATSYELRAKNQELRIKNQKREANVSGETDLTKLIASMQPVVSEHEYVFAILDKDSLVSIDELEPLGTFYEIEGLTVIVLKTKADALGIYYQSVFQCITLNIHSSLEAVGLTAAVSGALASDGISANVVAAYYHDHIFVPTVKAKQALLCLQNLARGSE